MNFWPDRILVGLTWRRRPEKRKTHLSASQLSVLSIPLTRTSGRTSNASPGPTGDPEECVDETSEIGHLPEVNFGSRCNADQMANPEGPPGFLLGARDGHFHRDFFPCSLMCILIDPQCCPVFLPISGIVSNQLVVGVDVHV